MEHFKLNNGVEIPVLGFGVFQIPPVETKQAVLDAFEVGYRHIDTAQVYGNEAEVGQAITASGLPREELFITTKVWLNHYSYESAKASIEESLKKLQTDYADLILLHQPYGDVFGAFRALAELQEAGKIRAIGVSNFNAERLADVVAFQEAKVQVNQIEINPFHQREAERTNAAARTNVVLEAWAPFAEGKNGIFTNPVLSEIAAKHGKSVAQVILRWTVDRGIVALAKSVNKDRMAQNIDIFDFSLDDEDRAKVATLETSDSQFFSHDAPESVDRFKGIIEGF